ncbi:hypothetical protein C8J57DRAFT_1718152 [Mycena rebaudengoi]|nr:hypothetical protein C8J57DRAFT_1718152 [Mycena rebaudengoi]
MTHLSQAAATGTHCVPWAPRHRLCRGNPAVFQLLTAALASLNSTGTSDPTAVTLLSAALSALTSPSAADSPTPTTLPSTATTASAPMANVGVSTGTSTATTPSTAPTTPVLRTVGPWVVEGLYLVVPSGPLTAIIDDGEEHLWYSITKGRYVGVTTVNALTMAAVTRVSSASMISHKTQASAMSSFNTLRSLGLVEIR